MPKPSPCCRPAAQASGTGTWAGKRGRALGGGGGHCSSATVAVASPPAVLPRIIGAFSLRLSAAISPCSLNSAARLEQCLVELGRAREEQVESLTIDDVGGACVGFRVDPTASHAT